MGMSSASPVVVVPGRWDIALDVAAARCAACGAGNPIGGKARRPADGYFIMLCVDVRKCVKRYRNGLQPSGYAAMVRRGERP